MWWNGPEFLYENINYESNYQLRENEKEICLQSLEGDSLSINSSLFYDEVKNENVILLNTDEIISQNIGDIIDIDKFSEVNKLLRVTSYVVRFIRNLKRKLHGEKLLLNKYVTI